LKGKGKIIIPSKEFEAMKKVKAQKIKNILNSDDEDPPKIVSTEKLAEATISKQIREAAKHLGPDKLKSMVETAISVQKPSK
jgi:phage antirepressor YoqD-like protein